jgi:predicted DNA-binding transcriptional regulator AlpA
MSGGLLSIRTKRMNLISINATCKRLSCGRTWLYQQIKSNSDFPRPVIVGSRQYFKDTEIDQWISALPTTPVDGRSLDADSK